MRIILAAVLAVTIASPALALPEPEWQVSETARAGAERDFEILRENCPDLFGPYGDDVDAVVISAPAIYRPANVPATYIAVELSNDLQRVPPTLRAWGHTLHYYVRGDGISVQKDQSWQICGWQAVGAPGHDAFYPLGSQGAPSGEGGPDGSSRWLADSFRTVAAKYSSAARLMEEGAIEESVKALQEAEIAIQLMSMMGGDSKIRDLDPEAERKVADGLGVIMATRDRLLSCAEAVDLGCIVDTARTLAGQFTTLMLLVESGG